MASALQELVAFAEQTNSSFVCTNSGRSDKTNRIFVARILHVLNAISSADDLKVLHSMLGIHAASFEGIYAAHDGFVLYKDSLSDKAGIEALPICQWQEAGDDMRQWFEHLDDESDPDHIRSGVAFATVPQSGNYFVVPVKGPNAGKVFYADHDGWYESHFAADFAEFITRVTSNPVHLLSEELGCYARYSDGTTSIQWIPEIYNVG